jgi:hypothetical protein
MDDDDRTAPGMPPVRKIEEANTVAMDARPPIADDVTALGPLEPLDRTVGTVAAPGFVAHAAHADARTDLELEPPPLTRPAPTAPQSGASAPPATRGVHVDANPILPGVTATLLPGELSAVSPIAPDITAPMRKVSPSTPAPAPAPATGRARVLVVMLLLAAFAVAAGLWLRLS